MADRGSIVITGASTGMGEHCALGLAERGYRVFAGVRKSEDGERLKTAAKGDLTPIIIDVVKEDQVKAAAREVEQALAGAPLNALWNNAGISVNAPLEFIPLDDLRRQIDVNVIGQVIATQAFLPMIRAAKGRVLITGSIGGFFTTPMLTPYCMSKYAMEAMADGLRRELRPHGVQVVLLEPGGIQSKIWEKGISEGEELVTKAPPGMMDVYGSLVNGLRRMAPKMEKESHPPQAVLDCVIHALESHRPKTRYRMGANSTAQKIISFMPDRWQDALISKMLGT